MKNLARPEGRAAHASDAADVDGLADGRVITRGEAFTNGAAPVFCEAWFAAVDG